MKGFLLILFFVSACAAQDKFVYVTGTDQTAAVNVIRNKKECSTLSVTLVPEKADYVLKVDTDEYRAHWMLSDKDGKVIGSGESRKVRNSVKDACKVLLN